MGHLTSSVETDAVLVADTSVLINLNATGSAAEILQALPCRLIAVDVVVRELNEGLKKGRNDAGQFESLVVAGLIEVVVLGEAGLAHFEGLVVGAASETLDDGEAATIACALEISAPALIDERKAARLSARRFPELSRKCTVDLLADERVQTALGRARLAESVHRALLNARMQVPAHRIDWVLDLIGSARAAECLSLPKAARKLAAAG